MLFNSYEFIFIFLPVVLIGYYLLGLTRKTIFSISWVFLASCLFYAFWKPEYLLIVTTSILFNYGVGSAISYYAKYLQIRKLFLIFGLTINLAALIYFKYWVFLISIFVSFLNIKMHVTPIELPLGISFFTFVQIAFLIDFYRKPDLKYNFLCYSFFVTYFPHLIAGPIIHHQDLIPRLSKKVIYRFNVRSFSVGLFLFSVGLFKKVVIADHLIEPVRLVFDSSSSELSFFEAWIGVLAYTLEIYFDFSGYSDMALGISKLFNLPLPVNFYSPYRAQNIIDFWRRWHISLSNFLRDYLYIPLGGNRLGEFRRYGNLLTTMLLGGLWHGAGWTYIIWGGLHGVYLSLNHLMVKIKFPRLPKPFTLLCTFFMVTIAWVFFRSNSISNAFVILKAMSGVNGISLSPTILMYMPFLNKFNCFNNLGFFPHFPSFRNFQILGIFLLLPFVWFLPNSLQLTRKFTPGLHLHIKENSNFLAVIQWFPNFWWACFTVALFWVSILFISYKTVFLYFQF